MPRYEFKEGSSSKFWESTLNSRSFTATFGRIGTPGRSVTRTFDTKDKAQHEYDKLITEKTKKGYVLVEHDAAQPNTENASTPEVTKMRKVWGRIEKWLARHHPLKAKSLAPGATEEAIHTLEKGIGRSLPPLLRASLMIHNGESETEQRGLFDSEILMSTSEILEQWELMKGVVGNLSAKVNSRPNNDSRIRPMWWHLGWIPIARDDGGNFTCVDADPTSHGELGQMLAFDHETHPEVIGGDLHQWLTNQSPPKDPNDA